MEPLAQGVERALSGSTFGREIARAKINLALHVLGRRDDGFHDLETLVVFADFGDLVAVHGHPPGPVLAPPLSLALRGEFGEQLADETDAGDNLVIRAARRLARRAGKRKPIQIDLTKRLPLTSGLGGGSADAAATLQALNDLWELKLDRKTLRDEARELGADVPMCLVSKPLVARGTGEKIERAPGIPALPVVLAFPGGGLPTGSVFAALEPGTREGLPSLPGRFSSIIDFVHWLRRTRNDLVPPAAEVSNLARVAAVALHRDPESLFARMSGSGTSAFGIFTSFAAAERAAARIAIDHPEWWAVATMTGASPPVGRTDGPA